MIGDRAARVAATWIGTPYIHGAAVKGAGADCVGLLRGVWWTLYERELRVPIYAPDWAETEIEMLLDGVAERFPARPYGPPEPGDVLVFRLRPHGAAKHVGIATADGWFVHAYARHGVVSSPLSGPWTRRIVARFGWPEAAA